MTTVLDPVDPSLAPSEPGPTEPPSVEGPAVEVGDVDRPPVAGPDASLSREPVPVPGITPSSVAAVESVAHTGTSGRVRLYVWQAPVRITHWVTTFAIVALSVTGIYVADPFLIPPGGSVMTIIRLTHMVAAFTLIVSVALRVAWAFVGNRWSRWYAFIPTNRRQFTEFFRQAGFYLFVRRQIPQVLGHNQLAASAYLVIYALLFVEIVTGFALDGLVGSEPGATGFGLLRDVLGPQTLRLIHHLCMWAILALALLHIYSCVLVDGIEKNGLLSSIFSGFKYVTREEIAASRDGGTELAETTR